MIANNFLTESLNIYVQKVMNVKSHYTFLCELNFNIPKQLRNIGFLSLILDEELEF